MSHSPIPKVLSTFHRKRVRALLMGGQACILYGAAEFTRDVDFAVAVAPGNLARLRAALAELEAEPVYFPPLSAAVLARGHDGHFRCLGANLNNLRIDVMSKMRGVDPFEKLWKRREIVNLPSVGRLSVLALPDLVRAKKTQRDKDWPMVRRLIEADIARSTGEPERKRLTFWFRECRTFELLRDLGQLYPRQAKKESRRRPALRAAMKGDQARTAKFLRKEEDRERELDRRYWAPLKKELEHWRFRRQRRRTSI